MALIPLLITLIILGAVCWIAWWAISQVPMPQPIRVAVTVVFALIVIVVLLNLAGGLGAIHGLSLR